MIFEDHFDAGPPDAPESRARTARELLSACAAEARRQADALHHLDTAVGTALSGGADSLDPRALQMLDLLRQEADGLARLLAMASGMPSPDAIIASDAVARCVPLAAQRARLVS